MDPLLTQLTMQMSSQLQRLQARITQLERGSRQAQLTGSSIDNGAVYITDGSGTIRGVIGLQPDGTFTFQHTNSPPPPVEPSTPTAIPVASGLAITWDGNTADGTADWPFDFAYIQVHVSAVAGFTPDETTLAGVLHTAGAYPVAPLDPGTTYYACLVAINQGGIASTPSTETSGVPLALVIPPGTITETDIEDGSITTPKLAANAVEAGNIAADAVTANAIEAGSIDATKLAALIVLASTIVAGTEGGPGVQLDSSGLYGIDTNGNTTFQILATSGEATFAGTIVMSTQTGEFLGYGGEPQAGNLVASLSIVAGTDEFGNGYPAGFQMTGGNGSQVTVVPGVNIPFNTGSLEAVTAYSTPDVGELMSALVGSLLFNPGLANQQPASVFTSPSGTDGIGYALLLSGDSDDTTSAASLSFGTYSTDGSSVSYQVDGTIDNKGRMTLPASFYYAANPSQVIVTLSSGTSWTSPPNMPLTAKVEGWGPGGGGGANGGGGGGSGGYSAEPAAAFTANHAYTYAIGQGGLGGIGGGRLSTDGGITTFIADAVTLTCNGGGRGTAVPSAGGAAAASANTIALAGSHGGNGATNAGTGEAGGGGGAGAGGPVATGLVLGGIGQNGNVRSPGSPGAGIGGGGWGGWGGWGSNPGTNFNASPGSNGTSPGGGGGGGGAQTTAGGWRGGDGARGLIRITYTPVSAPLAASIAGAAGTDKYGNAYPAGYMGRSYAVNAAGTGPEGWTDFSGSLGPNFIGVTGGFAKYRKTPENEIQLSIAVGVNGTLGANPAKLNATAIPYIVPASTGASSSSITSGTRGGHWFPVSCTVFAVEASPNNWGARATITSDGYIMIFGVSTYSPNSIGIEVKIPLDV